MVTVVAGIASAKLAALLIGPSGVGRMSLVQGIAAMVAAIVELGLATSIVRAHTGSTSHSLTDFVATARRMVVIGGGIVIGLAVAVARPAADLVFGESGRPIDVVLGAASGLPVALLALENGSLIAAHRVGAVARVAIATAFVSPAVNLVWFSVEGASGVAPGALSSAAVVLGVAWWIRTREFARRPEGTGRATEVARAEGGLVARSLLRDGIPVMASALAGAGALLILPIIVADRLSSDDVGYFRAASVISLGYTAALTAVIGADFLPRVGRVRHDASAVRQVVVQQAELLTSALVPLLLLVAAALPILVEVLYRRDFAPTVQILEWQLSGDILRIVASILATAVFARFGGPARLASELLGLGLLVGLSYVGLVQGGLSGLGWGFSLAYVCYLLLLAVVLGFRLDDGPTRRLLVRLTVGSIAVGVPSWLVHVTGVSWARLIGVPLALAAAFPMVRRGLQSRRARPVSL